MSYYAVLLLAWRHSYPEKARKLARDIISGAPAPYMATHRQGAYDLLVVTLTLAGTSLSPRLVLTAENWAEMLADPASVDWLASVRG